MLDFDLRHGRWPNDRAFVAMRAQWIRWQCTSHFIRKSLTYEAPHLEEDFGNA
jgi:hypothetical protein